MTPLREIVGRRFLTTGQVAETLAVSPRTVRRWVEIGRLPLANSVAARAEGRGRRGMAWRFRTEDVDKMMMGGRG